MRGAAVITRNLMGGLGGWPSCVPRPCLPAPSSIPHPPHPAPPCPAAAGRGRPLLRPHPDLLVCCQGARHLLGHVEHCPQHGRLLRAHPGGHGGQGGCGGAAPHTWCMHSQFPTLRGLRRASSSGSASAVAHLPPPPIAACPACPACRPADVRLAVGHVCPRHRGSGDGCPHPAGRARLPGSE